MFQLEIGYWKWSEFTLKRDLSLFVYNVSMNQKS